MAANESLAAPHVVILGAGYAGSLMAKALQPAVEQGAINLTVVDRKANFHHKIGSFRASVQSEWTDRIEIPLTSIVKYGKVVLAQVTRVNPKERIIHFADEGAPDLSYDILVCATGASSRTPGDLPIGIRTTEQIKTYFQDISTAINESQRIVIVGGGASAVECAGEIRAKYAEKKVTIISADSTLLGSSIAPLNAKFYKLLRQILYNKNIEVINNQRVKLPTVKDFGEKRYLKNVHVTTSSEDPSMGRLDFDPDLVIWAASYWVDLDANIYPEEWLNELGELDIRDSFLLRHRNDIFAFGDVSSLAETKQAITLPDKIEHITNNVLAVAQCIRNGNLSSRSERVATLEKSLKRYKIASRATLYLPVGPDDGLSQKSTFWGTTVYTGAKTSELKGKDLYCDKFWRLLTGSDAPPVSKT